MIQSIEATAAEGAGDAGVGRHHGELRTSVDGEGRGGVEAEPAEQQDERAEHGHRDVVAGQGPGLAVLVELADAGPEHDGTGEGRDTTHGVHDAGAGEVDVAEARAPWMLPSWRASRRPRSRRRRAGSRWRRRTGPSTTNDFHFQRSAIDPVGIVAVVSMKATM